jgi:GNAT superfamily N-acetyltransferase
MKKLFKKILGKIDYLKRTINFFYWSIENKQNVIENSKFAFYSITNSSQLSNLDSEKENEYKKRFDNGHVLCYLKDDDFLSAYGWINPTNSHLFGELDLKVNCPDTVEVLYDFFTDEKYRGQGLYPLLLQKICNRNEKIKIGYALSENISSMKGLKKADFKLLAIIKGYNKGKFERILKKYE